MISRGAVWTLATPSGIITKGMRGSASALRATRGAAVAAGWDMAKNRTVYHVVPDSAADHWLVTQENNSGFRESYPTKAEAVTAARQRAEGQEPSQLKVHTQDGNMEYESTYGEDPSRFPS